eukprot:COSAG04_NODE_2924_length_3379_cov_6.106098_2_plen_104_part_00
MGEGSTCYYPVFVPGALFSCGDGHVSRQRWSVHRAQKPQQRLCGQAAQGDGEVSGTAIETAMHCTMRLTVLKRGATGNPGGGLPRYLTPDPATMYAAGPQFAT